MTSRSSLDRASNVSMSHPSKLLKQIQNRGFKPVMMGDLGPVRPGCFLVPHKAEKKNIEEGGGSS